MAESARYRALEQAGLLHPAAGAVLAAPFRAHPEFFASFDKGAGEVRDAARARDRRSDGEHGGADARLLAGSVLSGVGGVRALGDGRAVRRASRPARALEALAG